MCARSRSDSGPGTVRALAADAPTFIASVQRALRLLEAAAVHDSGAPAKTLARETGLALGTAYHLLRTLAFEGYLKRQWDGNYVLGEGISRLLGQGRIQAALNHARPALANLRDQAHAAAYISLYQDGEIVLSELVDGRTTPRVDLWVGFRDAAHATALGKCVLAALSPDDLEDYLSRHSLPDLTPYTITEMDRLREALQVVRRDGMAVDRQEYALGNACVALPIQVGEITGAVGVSFPAVRLSRVDDVIRPLRLAAARISRAVAFTI